MKAKRRQELKTNDLAQALEDMGQWFKDQGVYVVGALALVVVVVVIVSYRNSAKAEAIDRAYAELRSRAAFMAPSGVRKSDEELESSLAAISDLTTRTDDADFRLEALLRRGDMALRLAETGRKGIEAKYLGDARGAYQEIVNGYQDRTLHYGRALYGLFQVEADEFTTDGDARHREQAARYLKMLRDDARFNGMPFQTMAVDMLNELDSVFTVVTFAKVPAPSPAPETAPAPGPTETLPASGASGEESTKSVTEEGDVSAEAAEEEQPASAVADDAEGEPTPSP